MTEPKDKLSGKQLAVIEDLVGGKMNETAVLKVHRVSRRQFTNWLQQTDFTEWLRFWMDTTRRDAVMLLANNASKAVERLLLLAEKGTGDTARRACLDILTIPQTLTQQARQTSDKTTPMPDIDTQTAARVLEAMAKEKQKEISPASKPAAPQPADARSR